jgi:hypothetical protein
MGSQSLVSRQATHFCLLGTVVRPGEFGACSISFNSNDWQRRKTDCNSHIEMMLSYIVLHYDIKAIKGLPAKFFMGEHAVPPDVVVSVPRRV